MHIDNEADDFYGQASNLLNQYTTNPARRAFGFAHAISSLGVTSAPAIAAICVSSDTPVIQGLTIAFAGASAFAAVIGFAARNIPQDKSYYYGEGWYEAIAIEFASFVAVSDENCRHPVRSALVGGLKNGCFRNGASYVCQFAGSSLKWIGIGGAAYGKYIEDFFEVCETYNESVREFLIRNKLGMHIMTSQKADNAHDHVVSMLERRALPAPQA